MVSAIAPSPDTATLDLFWLVLQRWAENLFSTFSYLWPNASGTASTAASSGCALLSARLGAR